MSITFKANVYFHEMRGIVGSNNPKERTMSETKAPVAEKEVTPRKVRNITFNDTPMDIPPLVKDSIYPWEKLAAAKPLMTSFFVECENKEEADTLRTSVYASGRVYYQKRGIQLRPICRVLQVGDAWGVNAWATIDEGEDEEETTEGQ